MLLKLSAYRMCFVKIYVGFEHLSQTKQKSQHFLSLLLFHSLKKQWFDLMRWNPNKNENLFIFPQIQCLGRTIRNTWTVYFFIFCFSSRVPCHAIENYYLASSICISLLSYVDINDVTGLFLSFIIIECLYKAIW